MGWFRNDVHNAWKSAKALKMTEDKLAQTVETLMDFLADNIDRY